MWSLAWPLCPSTLCPDLTLQPPLTLCPDPSLTSPCTLCILFAGWHEVIAYLINFLCLIGQRTSPKQLQNTWKFTVKHINNELAALLEPLGNVNCGSREGTHSWKVTLTHEVTLELEQYTFHLILTPYYLFP